MYNLSERNRQVFKNSVRTLEAIEMLFLRNNTHMITLEALKSQELNHKQES
jgi:hypothetical protein